MRTRLSILAVGAVATLLACGEGTPSGATGGPGAPSPATSGGTGGSGTTGGTTPTGGGDAGTSSAAVADVCAPFASLPTETGELRARLESATILKSSGGTPGFVEPAGTDLIAFERAFEQLVRQPTPEGVAQVGSFGFTTTLFRQQDGAAFLLLEDAVAGRGAGTFAVNLHPARDLWFESPHADSDQGTLAQGANLFVTLGARAYLVTGANRCASADATPCDGKSAMCGGQLRRADAAHYANNYFTSAHRALRLAFPAGVAINVHGMDTEGVEAAVISDGTRLDRPSSLSVRFRDALNLKLPSNLRAFSCNDTTEDGEHRALCGTTNVQGRIDNGSTDACFAASTTGGDRFLHMEQNAGLRSAKPGEPLADAVIQALAEVLPCSLAGNGLGCASAPLACQ